MLRKARKAIREITGPWRLVSYFEIRSVICLLSKVAGRAIVGKLRYRLFGDRATGHWPMAMRTHVGDEIPNKCNLGGFADIVIDLPGRG